MDFINMIEDALSTYYYSTNISLSVIDDIGNEILTLNDSICFCKFFKECTNDLCPCSQTHLYASRQAEKIGEAYIFSCPAGLINYTVPIVKNGILKGAVIAGPFLMDFPDELLVDDIIQKFNLSINMRGKINTYLRAIMIIEPIKVRHLSKLLFILVTNLMGDAKHVLYERNLKYTQQAHICESIQDLKNAPADSLNIYEKEKELLNRVEKGDIKGAKNILNNLIGLIFFSSGGNIEVIKSRTLELCTLLSRSSIKGGADLNKTMVLNHNFISELDKINNLEDLSYWLITILDKFTKNAFKFNDSKNSFIIQKSIIFINENYKRNITLDTVANLVYLNPSYFSTLFKKELGISFSNYLNKIRIEQSKLLLNNTNYSILETALEVGFEDQSYFTKVFKNFTNMTPKEYRQKLLESKELYLSEV